MTELTLETDLDDEQRDYLSTARGSAESLLALLNDILDLSKIEAGKLDIDPVPFDLEELLTQTIRSMAFRAHQKGLEINCEIAAEVPPAVVGDNLRLRQILVNLIGNAIKFPEHGEIYVCLEKVSEQDEKLRLRFGVRDTGIGIAEGNREGIFEAFTQADGSTTRQYGGSGLGLTICARLVRLMNGKIWVESELGTGSKFYFEVEIARSVEPVAKTKPAAPLDLKAVRALVVDDNETNRRILRIMLASWGMEVDTVAGGIEALEYLARVKNERRPPRILLLDANMPGLDGFDVAARVNRDDRLPHPIIMMLSSADLAKDAERCRKVGIALYLTKPVPKSGLRRAIGELLGSAPQPRPEKPERLYQALQRRPLRVLVAEDNAVNQKVLRHLLEKRNHTTVIAANGREALECYGRERFDLILMDVQMPEMDGLAATRSIRKMESAGPGRTPIIALTANAMDGDREKCLDAGMDDYLAKPVRPSALFEAIHAWCESGAVMTN
jgi:CheY-like chemotaxis protein